MSHDGLVPCLDHDPQPVALDDAGGEEDHVPGLQDVGVALLRANGHSLALPSQPGIINLNRDEFVKPILEQSTTLLLNT